MVILAYGLRSETEYLIDEYIQTLTQRKALERENSKLKTAYTDITVIKESQFKHLQQLQQLVSHQQRQLLQYQQTLQQSQGQNQQQENQPSQQQLHLQPLQHEQQSASSQNSLELSIVQLQGDLEMTIAELTRAMEDVEMFKKRVEALELTNQELHTQLETKNSVNQELGQILESKIQENSKFLAEQNKCKAEFNLSTSLGSLKGHQLYAAVSVISEYYDLLAPLVESKSKEALKDLAFLKELNVGILPPAIKPGMLAIDMAMLRQQIFTESQMLQKLTMESLRVSSESIPVLNTPPQNNQTTPAPGPTTPAPEVTTPAPAPKGPRPGPARTRGRPRRIVAANQIAPGVQKNALKWLTLTEPLDMAPNENPPTPAVSLTPPTETSWTPNPPVLPTEPPVTTPLSFKTSTAALLQIHKQRMQEQQALHASKNPSISPQITSHGNANVTPDTDTASVTTSPTSEQDVVKPSESIQTSSKEELNMLAIRSGSEQELDLDESPGLHLEGSDPLSEKFRAIDLKRPEQVGITDEAIAVASGGEPTAPNPLGALSITAANLAHMDSPGMVHASSTLTSTSPKARSIPGYISPSMKRQAQDLSPTQASFSGILSTLSFLPAARRPKFPSFEMPVISKDKAEKSSESRLSHVGSRPKKGRWFLEAVEVPARKRVKQEESE
ncbi:hypothetical protein BGZ81_011817 [Podila clonocystis]|nr:hypothetical protein BGZ81_011817 [Podila clonocystis]